MIQKIQLNPWSDNLLKQKKTQDIYLQNGTEDELSNDEKMKLMKFCGSAKNCFLFIDKKKLNQLLVIDTNLTMGMCDLA